MGLSTADEYRDSLRDGRTLWYRGRRVPDILEEPDLRVAVDHAALDYEVGHDPLYRDLAVAKDPDSGSEYSAYYAIPHSSEDLLARSRLIETVTGLGGTMVTLVKEIGSDALFGLLRVLEGEARERAVAFYEHCRDGDLSVAVAQTDVKGDRSLPPHAQADPDLYVHVVEERADGIVVRGAKCHTSISANAHEIIVLPTRAMGPDDADYAVSFATPVDTPGLSLYVSAYGAREHDAFEFPISSKHKMLETLTVFDDVFVPWERVFLCRQPELAGTVSSAFVEFHRFTAVSYKLPLLDALVGTAALIAEMNGVAKAGHIREKLTQLDHLRRDRARPHRDGRDPGPDRRARHRVPRPAHHQHGEVHLRHAATTPRWSWCRTAPVACSSPARVAPTGPTPRCARCWRSSTRSKAPAEERLRLLNTISDLTARDFGGYHAVLAVHAEGSIEAEKMQIYRAYEPGRAVAYAAPARRPRRPDT